MSIRHFTHHKNDLHRVVAAISLGSALVFAAAPGANAYSNIPDIGDLLETDGGYRTGSTFRWKIQTPESEHIIVSVDNEVPASNEDCEPTWIGGHQATEADVASANNTTTVAFTLTHPGDHTLTAIDADTGETIAVNAIYAIDSGTTCTRSPELFATGEQESSVIPRATSIVGLLAGIGGLTYFGTRKRHATQIG